MIKINFTLHLLLVFIFSMLAKNNVMAIGGDTLLVRTHDKVHMNWYGNYDQWAVFPSDTNHYERIWLNYTLGCPTGGCSQWDYTTKILIRKRLGYNDSTLQQAPVFKVDNNVVDSLKFSYDTTFTYFYNSTLNTTDSSANTPIIITEYSDSLNPLIPIDTLTVWMANYYNYLFDATGQIIDSVFIQPDSVYYLTYNPYWYYFEAIDEFEIARVITPYGGSFANTWSFPYKFDVTDYAPLLKDSLEIRAFFDGWSDGFTVTLDFMFIKGTPARESYSVVNLWNGWLPYGASGNSIENYLYPKKIKIDSNASFTKLKIIQTGHGFGGNENCAEFCPKSNFIFINGTQKFTNLIWNDKCGLNPVFPQSGTWLYDRANWCPGDDVQPYEHELMPIVSAGDSATLDVNMTPFTNINNNNCGYTFGSHLVFYKTANFSIDASLEDIISPGKNSNYIRVNPVCSNPEIIIKNNGTTPLSSLDINYGVDGVISQSYQWIGNLSFLDTAHITLGNVNWEDPLGQQLFKVTITNPNGTNDEYNKNNTLYSKYDTTPVYPDTLILQFKTNLSGLESSWELKDASGNVVYSRNNMSNNKAYIDTFYLTNGCYELKIKDSGKDGLDFWANSDGTGYARLRKYSSGIILKTFVADFGTEISQHFRVGYPLTGIPEISLSESILIYPNPSQSVFNLDMVLNEKDDVEYNVFDAIGQNIISKKIRNIQSNNLQIDLTDYPAGIYILNIKTRKVQMIKKLIRID